MSSGRSLTSMSAVTDALASQQRPNWVLWLRRELAPFPGREVMTLRLVVAVVLVTIISMALQIPSAATSALMVFMVTKQNRVLSMLSGVVMIVGATVAIAASLFLYRYTFDYPEMRLPVMAVAVFTGMYLSRVFALGPLGFVIGFIIMATQSIAETKSDAEALVHSLLWMWVFVVYPIALAVVINEILLPAHPWTALARLLTQRLDAAASALKRALSEGVAGGQKNPALLDLATRGSSPLRALLLLAEIKEKELKRRHASLVAAIVASERLVGVTAVLEMRATQPLSENDRLCAQALLSEIARLRTAVQKPDFVSAASYRSEVIPTLPELRELQLATRSLHESLAQDIPAEAAASPMEAKKPLFVADAFTNPVYPRFALKVALAGIACYVIYSGLAWPGIHTAFFTCAIVALESNEATLRKGWLRIAGASVGGLLGFLAIMYLVPHMVSIVSLVLLVGVVTAGAGWVAAGSERIAYAGVQIAFAFYMCIFQGYKPGTDFDTIRDRLVGIVLGLVVSTVVFHYIWPERAVDRLRAALARALRNLARLLVIPGIGATIETERQAAAQLRSEITKDLDSTLRLSELAVAEDGEVLAPDGRSPATLEGLAYHTQAVSLVAAALSSKTELEEWQRLEQPAQEADAALRSRAAEQLQRTADSVANSQRPQPDDFESALTTRIPPILKAGENDRTRLLGHLVEQMQRLARGSKTAPI